MNPETLNDRIISNPPYAQRQWRPDWTAALRLIAVVVYSGLLIYFGTRRTLIFPGDELLSHDKLLHAGAFGGLGVLTFRLSCHVWPRMRGAWVFTLSAGFATLLGAVLELIQSCLPYRAMEFADLFADAVGAVLCVALARRWRVQRPLLGKSA